MTRLESIGTIVAILAPVIGGGIWAGTTESRVTEIEAKQTVQQEDHDRLIRVEEKVDLLIKKADK